MVGPRFHRLDGLFQYDQSLHELIYDSNSNNKIKIRLITHN